MTTHSPEEDQQPDALLEQARAIVRKIRPGILWEELDSKMPVVPGYMCRYDDLKRDFAIAIAREVLAQLPTSNDGEEQYAFEAWAGGERYDMTTHPLHWLFLNERTYAARQGWKAALEYVEKVMLEAAPTPVGQVDPSQALPSRTLEQHLVDESEGGHHD